MKSAFALFLAICAPLAAFASVDPPGSIALIRPNPKTHVPQGANLTFGFSSPTQQFFGLLQNIKMFYTEPDGTKVPSSNFGPAITQGSNDYSAAECRTYPGASTVNEVNATQVGTYTFFWNITYVMSSDPTKANDTYCGPPPFSEQNWVVNSTVQVIEANVGTAVIAAITTTTSPLPSKPTGKVNNAAIRGNVVNWGSVAGLLVGLGVVV